MKNKTEVAVVLIIKIDSTLWKRTHWYKSNAIIAFSPPKFKTRKMRAYKISVSDLAFLWFSWFFHQKSKSFCISTSWEMGEISSMVDKRLENTEDVMRNLENPTNLKLWWMLQWTKCWRNEQQDTRLPPGYLPPFNLVENPF